MQNKRTSASPSTVLVADDDKIVRTLLKASLQQAGFQVVVAEDGKMAIERMNEHIGAVLLDLQMPQKNGLECLRIIREQYPDISPIMITASDDVADAVEAMKQGAFDYVTKPFHKRQVVALVNKVLKDREQARRLKQVEAELEQAREHEIFLAGQIQQSLLLGQPPKDFSGIDIAKFSIPSQKVDGDFYDFYRLSDDRIDLVIADVMGKGIMAAFLGAAIKSNLLRVLNELRGSQSVARLPEPQDIIAALQAGMIDQLESLETFATMCYARFDLTRRQFIFVDCGHVRTIHVQSASQQVVRHQGINMPLGFPEIEPFTQTAVAFQPQDLFFFYSDGLTEAQNTNGDMFGEDRLADLIQANAQLSPQALLNRVHQEIVQYTQSNTFSDDFTCIAVKIPLENAKTQEFAVPSNLSQLQNIRDFVGATCRALPPDQINEARRASIDLAATEVATNIIRHAHRSRPEQSITIQSAITSRRMEFYFFDHGDAFNPDQVAQPIFDGSTDGGFGVFIIRQIADEVEFSRDPAGRNCTRLTFYLNQGDS